MKKRLKSITAAIYPVSLAAVIVILWQAVSASGAIPRFMLPAPTAVLRALITEAPLLLSHAGTTLFEAVSGLLISVAAAFVLAVLMNRFTLLYKCVYPLAVVTQTIPTIAIAPLLVLWMGYGIAPKITVVFITCFFPLLVGLLDGLSSADGDVIGLYRSMGAGYLKTLTDVRLPYALESFFSGLKISAAYSVVGAVIAEWLGGSAGLGVYMTRVRKAYAYDKMFAVIIVITVISLLFVYLVNTLKKASMQWKKYE